MSLKTSPIFPSREPAEYAKNLRKAVKEGRVKNSKKNVKSRACPPDNAATTQLSDASLAQHMEEVKDFFSDTASINTLVAAENASFDSVQLTQTVTPLGREKEIKLYHDSDGELRKLAYRDQTLIGKREFEVEEYLDSSGNLREVRYVVDKHPLVIYLATDEAPSAKKSDKQSEFYESLSKKLQSIKNYYCDLDSEWWFTSEDRELDKKNIQAQLIEIFDISHDFIEYLDKRSAQYPDELEILSQEQNAEFIAKIDSRIKKLSNVIAEITENQSLPSAWEWRLDLFVGVISLFSLFLDMGITAAICTSASFILKAGAKEFTSQTLPQVKSKKLIKGVIDLLEQDIKNEKAKVEMTFAQRNEQAFAQASTQSNEMHAATAKVEDESTQILKSDLHKPRAKNAVAASTRAPQEGMTTPSAMQTSLSQEIQDLKLLIQEKFNEAERTSTLTLVEHRKLKKKYENAFQIEAQNLRNSLVKISNEAGVQLTDSQSDQILSSLISDGLSPDKNYREAVQNLVNNFPLSGKIKFFLDEKDNQYWQSLQELKPLYLEEGMNSEEIENELFKHAEINHSQIKLASEDVLKAAQL